MARRLVGSVPIHGEAGEVTWYHPGDKIPAAVAKTIGDHAWIDDDESEKGAPRKAGVADGDAE